MESYQFFAVFTDKENSFSRLEHLQNLTKILQKFEPLHQFFTGWRNPEPLGDGVTEVWGDTKDLTDLKKVVSDYNAKHPPRTFDDLPLLAKRLEAELPNMVHISFNNPFTDNDDMYVGGRYSSDNRLPNGWGSQHFEMSFGEIFKTLDDYMRFMIRACEIMCSEKKQIERIAFGSDKYGLQRVFKHRQPANWMVFYPTKINPKEMQVAARVIPIQDYGTLIVAVDEVFEVGNPQHIDKVNQVEIRLTELGLLKALPEMP